MKLDKTVRYENYKNFILKELNKCKKNIENNVIKFDTLFK